MPTAIGIKVLWDPIYTTAINLTILQLDRGHLANLSTLNSLEPARDGHERRVRSGYRRRSTSLPPHEHKIMAQLGQVIVGQTAVIEELLISLV